MAPKYLNTENATKTKKKNIIAEILIGQYKRDKRFLITISTSAQIHIECAPIITVLIKNWLIRLYFYRTVLL